VDRVGVEGKAPSPAVRLLASVLLTIGTATAMAQLENTPAGSVYVEGTICVSGESTCFSGETLVPGTDLKIKGTTPMIYFDNTTGSGSDDVEWYLRSDANRFRLVDHGISGSQSIEVFSIFSGAPANSLRITAAGDVGLGISQAQQRLHIYRSSDPAIRFEDLNHIWDLRGNSVNFTVRDVDNGTIPLAVSVGAPSSSILVGPDGNVGFGNEEPIQAVDVMRSEAAARFQLTAYTADATQAPQYIQRRARGTVTVPAAVLANDNLGLFSFRGYNGTSMTGSKATITVQAAGNWTAGSNPTRILFGTTPVGSTTVVSVMEITPDKKVKINGATLNVPDYVFEDDYELMPLEELQAFITKHGHLPGIASADEVQAEGLDLGGAQMSQLQKIEELTLYTLQQQRSLSALQAENAELRTRLEQVEQLKEMVAVLMQERNGKLTLAASEP